jgi:hypothetical protein
MNGQPGVRHIFPCPAETEAEGKNNKIKTFGIYFVGCTLFSIVADTAHIHSRSWIKSPDTGQ